MKDIWRDLAIIIKVPASLKSVAQADIENFIRDIANITERGAKPFFRRVRKIRSAIKDYPNPFDPLKKMFPANYKCLDEFRRFMHIDLGHTGDSVGIAMSHVPRFVERELLDTQTQEVDFAMVPVVRVDFWGKIRASKRQEIILSEVRDIVYDLARRGFYFGLITFDRFQSIDSIQTLRHNGFTSGHYSVDRTNSFLQIVDRAENELGYKKISTEGNYNASHTVLRDLLYDDRIELPYSLNQYDTDYFEEEVKNAQETKTGKVDHPPGGSNDVEQAVAASAVHCIVNEKMMHMLPGEEDESRYEDKFYRTAEDEIDRKLLSNNLERFELPNDPREIGGFNELG